MNFTVVIFLFIFCFGKLKLRNNKQEETHKLLKQKIADVTSGIVAQKTEALMDYYGELVDSWAWLHTKNTSTAKRGKNGSLLFSADCSI